MSGIFFELVSNAVSRIERAMPAPVFSAATMAYNQIASAIFGVFLGASLGAETYGTINLARSIFLILLVATPLGLDLALQKSFVRGGDSDFLRCSALLWLRGASIALSIAAFLCAAFGLGDWLEAHVFQYQGFALAFCVTLAALPFATDNAVLGGAYRGILRPIPSLAASYLVQPTLRILLIVPLLALLDGAKAVVWGALLSWALAWLFVAAAARRDFGGAFRTVGALSEAGRILRLAPIMCLSTLVFTIARSLDSIALGYFASNADVGRYAAVQMVGQLVAIIGASLGQTLGARVAAAARESDHGRLRALLHENMSMGSLLSAPFCVAVALWGKDIDLLLGPSFVIPSSVFIVASLTQWLITTTHYASAALTMTGRLLTELHNNFAALAFQICAALVLVPALGIDGAALSTGLSILLINVLRQRQIAAMLGAPVATFHLALPLLLSATIALPIWLLGATAGYRAWWLTALEAMSQVAISLGVLLIFYADGPLRAHMIAISERFRPLRRRG
ncbi:oligosaccharide flippase family protein [Methylocystis parvus]|uniref:Oligosaccharide flippase family protein n=2 Tax=Methylocystis parvus TaxID=134 RepID=A0A6B8M9Y3_9HYPH|nr:oligosaccharide flippase family protein [Methylocystis parvus]